MKGFFPVRLWAPWGLTPSSPWLTTAGEKLANYKSAHVTPFFKSLPWPPPHPYWKPTSLPWCMRPCERCRAPLPTHSSLTYLLSLVPSLALLQRHHQPAYRYLSALGTFPPQDLCTSFPCLLTHSLPSATSVATSPVSSRLCLNAATSSVRP